MKSNLVLSLAISLTLSACAGVPTPRIVFDGDPLYGEKKVTAPAPESTKAVPVNTVKPIKSTKPVVSVTKKKPRLGVKSSAPKTLTSVSSSSGLGVDPKDTPSRGAVVNAADLVIDKPKEVKAATPPPLPKVDTAGYGVQ